MVERKLLEHWERERAARLRLRDSLPLSWRNDPRPKMGEVCELYVESMLDMQRSAGRPMAIGDDDR